MAKTKQQASTKNSNSAAGRREQMRQQQQRVNQNAQAKARSKNSRRRKSGQSPWLLVGGILVMVAVVVGIFLFLSRQSNTASTNTDPAVIKTITSINQATLSQVGTGGVQNLMKPVKNGTPLVGPNGKPEVFYYGAEYCPYCAAQRWAVIVALSRFGTFGNLSQLTSSESSVPTYTFHSSAYTSQYVDFVAIEGQDNSQNTLENPTAAQVQLVTTYDAPPYTSSSSAGSIPFIDIANQQV